jgi:hypothetical protein
MTSLCVKDFNILFVTSNVFKAIFLFSFQIYKSFSLLVFHKPLYSAISLCIFLACHYLSLLCGPGPVNTNTVLAYLLFYIQPKPICL